MNEIGLEAKKLAILLEPMVAMIVKEIRPKSDEVTMNQAYKEFGRRWIDQQRREGNLTERVRGNNRIYLSRAEIKAIRAAETTTPQLLLKIDKAHGFESIRDGEKVIIRKCDLPKTEDAPKKRGRKPKMILNAGI